MFERFTDRARQVVVLAQDEARSLGHSWIGTEHLLLGILREEGPASEALAAGGLSLERARAAVVALVGSSDPVPSGQIPFLPQAKRALETSLRETLRLRATEITPALVLLGVLMQRSGTSACVLRDCGVDLRSVVVSLGMEESVEPLSVQPFDDAAADSTAQEQFRGRATPGAGRSPEGGPGLFRRFTERARQAIVLAEDEARGLKHDYLGTEHILLGLLREEGGIAARVLASLELNVDQVRAQLERIVGPGEAASSERIPFTPRAKKVLELALREALSLGHNYIGTEHVLLGLVREHEGVATRILLDFELDAETVRNEVIRVLSAARRPEARGSLRSHDPPGRAIDEATLALSVGELLDSLADAKRRAAEAREVELAGEIRILERQLRRLVARAGELLEPGAGASADSGE